MNLVASQDDIVAITGYLQRKKQIEFLDSKRIKYLINGKGDPVVLISTLEEQLGTDRGAIHARAQEPDYSCLDEEIRNLSRD